MACSSVKEGAQVCNQINFSFLKKLKFLCPNFSRCTKNVVTSPSFCTSFYIQCQSCFIINMVTNDIHVSRYIVIFTIILQTNQRDRNLGLWIWSSSIRLIFLPLSTSMMWVPAAATKRVQETCCTMWHSDHWT